MNTTVTKTDLQAPSALQQARALTLPTREEVLHRAPAVQEFWHSKQHLLADAWSEWEASARDQLALPDESLLDARLRDAVAQAWQDPTQESAVQALWEEVSPGVYMAQFFDPDRLADLRAYLEAAANAHIPTRPPYGIVLNRYGAMLDPRSEGYLAAPSLQRFYQTLMDTYMRPISRLLFPEVTGYDTQSFGFSIRYQVGVDTSLRLHTDASAATLNLNLNLPGEEFSGSEVDFYDRNTGDVARLKFKPGTAMLHRGSVAHAAQAITAGERSNWVLWLYGDQGQIPRHEATLASTTAQQRWSPSSAVSDGYAPF